MAAESQATGVPFVHLRTHSAYSLSEGALPIKQMAKLAADMGMPALAITDTGNLFGALEFSEAMIEKGIQPIIGITLQVDFRDIDRDHASRPGAAIERFPVLALLAKDETGYGNLMRLSSKAFLETPDHAEPHVTIDLLTESAQGLICLTGGPNGPLDVALRQQHAGLARDRLLRLRQSFGDRLYVELQRHGSDDERICEDGLVALAFEHDLPLVATNEAYFAKSEDYAAHDALLCIADGEVLATADRRRVTTEHYFKTPQEMAALFADIPEAIASTMEIARRCAFFVKSRKPILPKFTDGDEAALLREEARAGLEMRFAERPLAAGSSREDYRARLEFELDVIIAMKFPGYFLIVADFVKHAKSKGIPVGPGRGSGAGSLVAYSLTITDLDPIRFNLLFERFLNPERVSMPDFDIDFCQDRRDEVIDYVQERHGKERVAQIITFGKLQARAVCRDVGRVLQMPYGQVDRLCKLIPMNPANPVSLAQAIEGEPRFQEERDRDPVVKTMLDIGLKLEGLYRHASTHAAGIVIGDRPLEELVPLYRDPRSSIPATQFNMKYVEKAGLVKFDFLGLKTLTVIDKAQQLIRRREPGFDISKIPLDDAPTYHMLAQGDTVGVFQLESSGMRDAVKHMHADRFEDLIALVALYRPGPMANIPVYCSRKLGREPIEYMHPGLEPILKETFGVITYQEQVQQIAKDLAGYSLASADLLRRAMGKKIKSEMDAQREHFLAGAIARNIDPTIASQIFDACAKFAEYGFNKSHSAPYAYISYQTAFLKANYPVEFLAASMSLDVGNTDKLMVFKNEAQRLGVRIVPPCVNASTVDFEVADGAIVYSLAALKNVGQGMVRHIVETRAKGGPFTSLGDFARRMDSRELNRRAVESLVKAGAFDLLTANRAQVLHGIDAILAMASRTSAESEAGQNDLFGAVAGPAEDVALPAHDAWLPMERLSQEFEAVGFYLSGHPLDDYVKPLQRLGVETWASFLDKALNKGASAAKLAGTVTHRQERRAKSGTKFAFVGFSDPTGQFEAICFSDTLAVTRDLLEPGKAVIARVEADVEGEEVRLRLQGVEKLDETASAITSGVTIFVRDAVPVESIAKRLTNGGRSPVRIILQTPQGREVDIALGSKFTVTPQVKAAIKAISGVVDVQDL
ncbi:MAG: DNA polymerase III subunit alpha [Hyphomicrobiales bacterium]